MRRVWFLVLMLMLYSQTVWAWRGDYGGGNYHRRDYYRYHRGYDYYPRRYYGGYRHHHQYYYRERRHFSDRPSRFRFKSKDFEVEIQNLAAKK